MVPSTLIFITESLPFQISLPDDPLLDRPPPLKREGWEFWLKNHPDREFSRLVDNIILRGVRLGYAGPRHLLIRKAHPTAMADPQLLSADIQTQNDKGRLLRLQIPPKAPFVASPLGLVPKHDGGWRRIHDLSHPTGLSVNDFIPPAYGSLEYVTFDESVTALATQGVGAVLIKKDLSDAFRHIPVAMMDRWLLGFVWNDVYWVDCFLPFGLRTAPFLFDLFAKALHWVLVALLQYQIVLHYLDDFFAILPPHTDSSPYNKDFDDLCQELGLMVNRKKDVAGTTAEFLGVEMDSVAMEIRLPANKLEKALIGVRELLSSRFTSHKQLESLVGLLSFASEVITLGRTFLRRLYNALAIPTIFHHISSPARADLLWWNALLTYKNGICVRKIATTRPSHLLWTDASGKAGCGGYLLASREGSPHPNTTFACAFPRRLGRYDIQFKEMMAILEAIRRWRQLLERSYLIVHCDNSAVTHGLRKLSIKGPAMAPLRQIAVLLAAHDITHQVKWIDSKANSLADMLSRFQFGKIANIYPQLRNLRASPMTPSRNHQIPGMPTSPLAATPPDSSGLG